ncbi:hypothetical protein FHR32_000855 [Streptosporangium album]|uniref:Uncharacterized protein n=1 Tax=Streptosporangium album TaxID=47479 RepID=A0A7W7RQZ6_9ACTN|nr:hypothetical protein [Streptosporangium album]MBB4936550.1 hypothetical protein [Streptosporangium album]
MVVRDVYFLALHEPYLSPEHSVAINATLVHALTLLHPAVPQPEGGLMYRCLTEFPDRSPGCVVPLSTLTFELDGGQGWDRIGDWEQVVQAVVTLARARRCDAMPLGLPQAAAVLLANGPTTITTLYSTDGTRSQADPVERQWHVDELTALVREFITQGAFWPGEGILPPPEHPAALPYKPYKPGLRGFRFSSEMEP